MDSAMLEKLMRINARMAELLQIARDSGRGQRSFGAEEIRFLREPLEEMQPILDESTNFRGTNPEIAAQLDLYKSQLRELLITVQQVERRLLARRTELTAGRAQIEAVSHWANALSSTR
jgi:hypothetical protein